MPLGGYDLGSNVWTEGGQVRLYAGQSGSFDENGTLLKLCRLRLTLSSMPMGNKMTQTLYPARGAIEICEDNARLMLWACPSKAELHIDYSGPESSLALHSDVWRWRDRAVSQAEMGQCQSMNAFGGAVTRADTVRPGENELLSFHANGEDTLYPLLIAQQKLDNVQEHYPDLLAHRVSGVLLRAPGLTYAGVQPSAYNGVDAQSYEYASAAPRTEWHVVLTALSGQFDSPGAWEAELRRLATLPCSAEETAAWWQARFEESFIEIDDADGRGAAAARNAALYRFMQLCNARGEFPTKFNGGLLTYDEKEGFTPDYRLWDGAAYTGQNQRLVYWPMLKNGDADAMLPQFEFYRRSAPGQEALTREALHHGGAFYDEHPTIFGMSSGAEYAPFGRREGIPYWDQDNPWIRLEFSSGLEFALMMLEYERWGGEISPYLDFIDSAVRFYFEHYPVENGRLRIFPSTALETYKGPEPKAVDAERYGAANPMDAVAGVRAVLDALIARGGDAERLSEYRAWRALCPELPVGVRRGVRQFLPAAEYAPEPFNCELPQLYRVYPYSPDGLSAEEIELGRAALRYGVDTDEQRLHISWHQNGIFAARLGLMDEAKDFLLRKLSDGVRRFPAFWGPGHDWTPDHNWGGSGLIQLQEMLLRTDGDEIVLFPCWPKDWDAHFRLHAPGGVAVEVEMHGGQARLLDVSPAEARTRIRIAAQED